MHKEKVLLDTDIGSDIDDAVCLAYMLANPQCELLGITTVTGEAQKRAQLASAICQVAGHETPIYAGCEQPILCEQLQKYASQAVALDRWPHQKEFPHNKAIPFLSDMIHTYPGEVTLLTIGPLTNIGLLFRFDPDIPALLKKLVMMCGVFTNRLAGTGPLEWNAKGDPHATAIVYNACQGNNFSIGLDVTCQVRMSAEKVKERFTSPLLAPVLDFAEVWFKEYGHITFHDPLAATTIFNPEICQFEQGKVEIELTSERMAGMTHWKADNNGPHSVALGVDPDRFFAHFFDICR